MAFFDRTDLVSAASRFGSPRSDAQTHDGRPQRDATGVRVTDDPSPRGPGPLTLRTLVETQLHAFQIQIPVLGREREGQSLTMQAPDSGLVAKHALSRSSAERSGKRCAKYSLRISSMNEASSDSGTRCTVEPPQPAPIRNRHSGQCERLGGEVGNATYRSVGCRALRPSWRSLRPLQSRDTSSRSPWNSSLARRSSARPCPLPDGRKGKEAILAGGA